MAEVSNLGHISHSSIFDITDIIRLPSKMSIAETVIEYGGQTDEGGFDHEAMMENITAQVEAAPAEEEESSGGFYVSRDDGSSHYSNGNGYNRATDADGDVTESYYGNTINR